jgi:hypothetical protein
VALRSYRAKVKDCGVEGNGVWLDVEVREPGKEGVRMKKRVFRSLAALDEDGLPNIKGAMEEVIRCCHAEEKVKRLKGMEHGEGLTFKDKD